MFLVKHLIGQIEAILSRDGANCGICTCVGVEMEVISLILRRWDAVSGAAVVQRFSSVLPSFSPVFNRSDVSSPASPPPLLLISLFHLGIPSSLRAVFLSSSLLRNVRVMKPLCLYSEPAPVQY